jgi:hypothetical protein
MKQFDVKSTKKIGENTFYLRPLPAYKCANLSGELASLVVPLITSVAPIVAGKGITDLDALMDIDAEIAAPALAKGMSELSGDKVETLLRKLLTTYKNVSVELEGENEAQLLTEDLVNEVFCGDVQDMFILAFEVIKVNFAGFFKKLGGQFGSLLANLSKGSPS